MDVISFDEADPESAAAVVRVWADIPTWVQAVVNGRPYGSVAELTAAARAAAQFWSPADLEAALAHHPRIGEKPKGSGAEAAASRSEQSSMARAGDDLTSAIAAGNAEYERRFGRVFLIRAAGRSPQEMHDELQRRLGNDPESETREALGQLREIALLRLETTLTDGNS